VRTIETTLRRPRRDWLWINPDYRAAFSSGLLARVHEVAPEDRFHAKQGRSTGRLRLDAGTTALHVYLKRHERWPAWDLWRARLGFPGPLSPAGVEWRNLETARALGVAVPDAVAAGERIESDGRPRSFLMVRELDGEELHLAVPRLFRSLEPGAFARFKRGLVAELARLVARLHSRLLFHKDLYLCHVFLDPDDARDMAERLVLIDLQRLARHRWTSWRWRWKDLGQLLFSTHGVVGIDDRDRLRFWMHYRRATRLRLEPLHRAAIVSKAARYQAHNAGVSES
jgi:heptose I phosphotransferase